jgi:glycosyltransferase involved in cell wall biosynthesis
MSDASIAVCALTFHRPLGLRRLLDGLVTLERPAAAVTRVFIVDNDPAQSAAAIVAESAAARPDAAVQYLCEPTRGIWAGRNRAVRAALEWGADAVCFIDDDEWPEPRWLRELVRTARSTGADVVTGPVYPAFDEEPPRWIREGGFFDRPRFRHHELLDYATTSSVLIVLDALPDRETPFEAAFGLSGGDDTHLFAQLHDAGRRIVWCDRAEVHEAIPASRTTVRWLLRRQYRRGQTLSLSLRLRDPRPMRDLRRVVNASIGLARGAVELLVGLAGGRARWVRGAENLAFGAGMLTGLAGLRYDEYQVTQGS